MSDFDKEAEREKLRKKFAKDEQKREQTSRMSELLLKGATMTNKHHDCGSPVFRWEGEEFCPTCQGAPDGEGVAVIEGSAEESETMNTANGTTVDIEATEQADGELSTSETAIGTPDEPVQATSEQSIEQPPSEPTKPRPQPPSSASVPGEQSQTDSQGASGGELHAARDSLARTLTSLAQRAETTTDVSRQRELLAAATEAAEALEATDRVIE
jgi:uncharacterized Zn finger protein (UPF0148 family)